MTADAANPSTPHVVPETGEPSSALRDQGLQRLLAGDHAQAIDLLHQAAAQNPDDPSAQLGLGIALQGMRRHAEALEPLERAQKLSPQGPLAFLHVSVSLLALDRAEAALRAAEEACARAPERAQAHSARGEALMALNDPARAEEAFAEALRRAPQSADVWVLSGAARYRQGAIEGARAAMREALRHAPGHAAAKANLAELERMTDGKEAAAASSAPNVWTAPAFARPEVKDDVGLSVWRPKDPAAALGLAVEFLIKKPAFARLQFGEWSQVLVYQVARGHYFFAVDRSLRVQGFLGWALTSEALADQWVEGRAGLESEQCREGDCVIVNVFAAETGGVKRFIVNAMRGLFADKRTPCAMARRSRTGSCRPI